MRNKRYSDIVRAAGMIITALAFVISWVSTFFETPQIKDWRIGIIFSFILFAGFCLWHFLELQRKIKELEIVEYILKIYHPPYYSVMRLQNKNKLINSADPIVARMQFFNQPIRRSKNAIARKVAAQLIFYDIKWNPLLEPVYGMWSLNDEVQDTINLKEGTKEVDFEPNGLPHELFLLMKYRDDSECYAVTNESFEYGELKYPHLEINRKRFYLRIRLLSTNGDAVEFDFLVKSHGASGRFEIEEYKKA
jgi:hypothetical protein